MGREADGVDGGRGTVRGAGRGLLVLACTAALLAGPVTLSAYAAPRPGADRPKAEAPADPGARSERSLEKIRRSIDRLNDRAELATDAYNAAEEKADKQKKKVDALHRRIAALRHQLAGYRQLAGALARAQYRGGGLPVEARLILQRDPNAFMRDVTLAHKGQQAAKGLLTTLGDKKKRYDALARQADAEWRRLEADRKQKAAAKKQVEAALKQARQIEQGLAKSQLKRLEQLEDEAAKAAQSKWLASGVLDDIRGRSTKAGRIAIGYAMEQLGKDYQWGAEGPRTYDCSGLTMRAWQAAGHPIPRTSQEQFRQLKHIPIEKMRPGDLIIYEHTAGHVGMYIGGGEMINAPHTGAQVRIQGAGSMYIKGVVRPDA